MTLYIFMIICAMTAEGQQNTVITDSGVYDSAEKCLRVSEKIEKEFSQQCTQIKVSCKPKILNQ